MVHVYSYYPSYGFRARLYWHSVNGDKYKVRACHDGGGIMDPGDGWLHAGPDNYSGGHHRLIELTFWFKIFEYSSTADRCYQMICVPERDTDPFSGYHLETSVQGFLGLYKAPWIFENPPNWSFRGLDPFKLKAGEVLTGLELNTGVGQLFTSTRKVRCNNNDPAFSYLNDRIGTGKGTFSLEVLEVRRPSS